MLLEDLSNDDFSKLKRVIVLDCQWHKVCFKPHYVTLLTHTAFTTQANALHSHPNLAKLKRVRIHRYSTTFWRYQKVGPECLATIEAIYYFYR